LDAESHLRFSGHLDNLASVKLALGADTLAAKAFLHGQIYGKMDSLTTEASFVIEDFIYNTMLADSVLGQFLITRRADSLSGRASTQVRKARFADFPVEAIDLHTDLDHRQHLVFLDFTANDSLSGRLQGRFIADTLQPRLVISAVDLNIARRHFTGGTDSLGIVLGENTYAIHNLRLAAGEQAIWTNGEFSRTGAENLRLQIQNLDVSMLAELANLGATPAGTLNLNAKLAGTPDSLILDGDLAMQNARINELAFETLQAKFGYANKNFRWNLAVAFADDHGLNCEGSLPMNLSWTDTGAVVYRDKPVRLKAESSELPVELLPTVVKTIQSPKGRIKFELEIENTLAKPQLNGFLTLSDVAFSYPQYGISYSDLQMQLSIDDTTLSLAHLQARSSTGSFKASGKARFDKSIATGKLSAMNFDLSAENFLVASNKNVDAVMSGALKLTGTLEKSEYNGAITVLRSRFYLPAFVKKLPLPRRPRCLCWWRRRSRIP
jgi:autotransporter translocation and assembly factor TamB